MGGEAAHNINKFNLTFVIPNCLRAAKSVALNRLPGVEYQAGEHLSIMTDAFLFKLVLTPLIIGGVTLIVRRWGEHVGGLIVGLPLTSGPVSIFFALEQGHRFAADAALGAILGLIPVAVFCTAYVQAARRFPWYLASLSSILAYLAAVVCMSLVRPGLGLTAVVVPSVLAGALVVLGKLELGDKPVTAPWWDLPARIVLATVLVLLITTGAGTLGPRWSGLLSPFPIFSFVMATFTHSQGGAAAVWRWIRGVLAGLFSYAAFFLVVALLVERTSLWVVYALAAASALSLNAGALAFQAWKHRTENRIANRSLDTLRRS